MNELNVHDRRKLAANATQATQDAAAAGRLEEADYYVYASFNRPINVGWANLPDRTVCFNGDARASWLSMEPHTWVFSVEPLPRAKVASYELTLALVPTTPMEVELWTT